MDLIIIIIFAILTYAYLNLNKIYRICTNKREKIQNKGPNDIFNDPNLNINIKLAKKMLKNNEFDHIIDARRDRAWIMGHHPDALHIQTSSLESRLPDKILNKNNKILLYAHNKESAKEAAKIIKKLGYKRIKFIDEKYDALY